MEKIPEQGGVEWAACTVGLFFRVEWPQSRLHGVAGRGIGADLVRFDPWLDGGHQS